MIGALIERLRRSPLRALAWVIATGFGTGLSPVAPRTVGSLAAVVLYYFSPLDAGLLRDRGDSFGDIALFLLVVAVSYYLGVWAANRVVSPDDPDPRYVVWDEFVGMWVTCLFLPKARSCGGYLDNPFAVPICFFQPIDFSWLAIAFIVFRLLHKIKPFPMRYLEGLPGGQGIMADDVMAAVYGAVICNAFYLWIVLHGFPFPN